jgi:hypothetical protein
LLGAARHVLVLATAQPDDNSLPKPKSAGIDIPSRRKTDRRLTQTKGKEKHLGRLCAEAETGEIFLFESPITH